jgi:hypothetical protein
MRTGNWWKREDSALRAGIFKAYGSIDPIGGFVGDTFCAPPCLFIVSMSPSGYPSAELRPRRARFRFARQNYYRLSRRIL